ncbi:MAG: hypothetical protein KBA15_09930, partial [Spirochaetes bacterium]|nr:hypothetical protein [Spirochaetota bacterium]
MLDDAFDGEIDTDLFDDDSEGEAETGSSPASAKHAPGKKKKARYENFSDSSITWYLEQINKIPLLIREEEESCARAARDGDEKAKEK